MAPLFKSGELDPTLLKLKCTESFAEIQWFEKLNTIYSKECQEWFVHFFSISVKDWSSYVSNGRMWDILTWTQLIVARPQLQHVIRNNKTFYALALSKYQWLLIWVSQETLCRKGIIDDDS